LDQLPFIPGQIIVRKEIHAQFGGNSQSGISASARFPYIFIFSGAQGRRHGYEDAWDNPDIFYYSGEGQSDDMTLTRGNLALRNHQANGKRVFLFEYVKKGLVKFTSELEYFDLDTQPIVDTSGKMRNGIRFFFKRKGAILPAYADDIIQTKAAEPALTIDLEVPTTKQSIITTRVGQGAYRKRIIHRWEYKCAVTGFHHQQALIASHIVPWRHADDDERLDVNNGILLSPTYDALFDRRLISFENSGQIILSEKIQTDAFKRIGVTGSEKIKKFNSDNHVYLDRHRIEFAK
jgi:5-methylcytosine-specific restriction protein A